MVKSKSIDRNRFKRFCKSTEFFDGDIWQRFRNIEIYSGLNELVDYLVEDSDVVFTEDYIIFGETDEFYPARVKATKENIDILMEYLKNHKNNTAKSV